MENINEILARAAALRDETALNSIDPERAGSIMYDTLIAMNELWLQQGAALVISKIYASVAAMQADTSPVSDLTGKPIRPGMVVVIASSDSDNGSVYRYNGPDSPSWSLVGKIGNLEPVDSLDSDSTQLPLAAHQGKVLDGKISQLRQDVTDKIVKNQSLLCNPGYVWRATNGSLAFQPDAYASPMMRLGYGIFGECYLGKNGTSSQFYGICFYNKQYQFISSYRADEAGTSAGFQKVSIPMSQIPSGAFYFAFSANNEEVKNKSYLLTGFECKQFFENHALIVSAEARSSIAGQFSLGLNKMTLVDGEIVGTHIRRQIFPLEKYVLIAVNGGETIKVTGTGSAASAMAVLSQFDFYQTDEATPLVYATGESLRVLRNDYEGTLPQDARYIAVKAIDSEGNNILPASIVVDGFDLSTDLSKKILPLIEKVEDLEGRFVYAKNITSLYERQGYFKVNDPSSLRFVVASGFNVTNLIPIEVGDIFITNTSEPGTSTAGHVLFNGDASGPNDNANMIAKIIPVNGVFTITQEMYDSGARYLGVSFRLSETPTPSVAKQSTLVLSEMERKIEENEADITSLQGKMRVQKINETSFYLIAPQNGKEIRYRFVKFQKTFDSITYLDEYGQEQTATNVVGANVWNIEDIYDGDGNYLMQGNANFIYNERGVTSHTGSTHGCEVELFNQFFADGKEVNPLIDTISCSSFRFIWKTNVYKSSGTGNSYINNEPALDTSGEPVVTSVHLLDAAICGGSVKINNSLTFKRDNLTFNQLHGAMFEANYGGFTMIVVNTDDKTVNTFDASGNCTPVGGSINLLNQPNNKANVVEMFGGRFFARQAMLPMRGCSIDNFVVASYNYPGSRLKNYFMPAGCYHFSPDAGVTPQTFNSGDVIAVSCDREIELR